MSRPSWAAGAIVVETPHMRLGADVLLVSLQVRSICAAHLATKHFTVSTSNQPLSEGEKTLLSTLQEHATGL